MLTKTQELEQGVKALVGALKAQDQQEIYIQIQRTKRLLNEIEKNVFEAPGGICSDVKKEELTVEEEPLYLGISYEKINTLPFLYKPTHQMDVYEGNYLEQFCEQRTEQLMKTLCINQHNAFWSQHRTVSGNVYGSIPKELIQPTSVVELVRCSWQVVNVDILDFGVNIDDEKNLISYCKDVFKHYILIVEESTKAYLALVYKIEEGENPTK